MDGVGLRAESQCGTQFPSFLSGFFLWPHSLINQVSALLGISLVLFFAPPPQKNPSGLSEEGALASLS